MSSNLVTYKIPVMLIKRKKSLVEAHMPSIDTVTQGKDVRDAIKMAKEAANIFFEDAIDRNVLDELLKTYGWKKLQVKGILKEPQAVGTTKFVEVKVPKAA